MTRRDMLRLLGIGLVAPMLAWDIRKGRAQANGDSMRPIDFGQVPGDKGYKHELYHQYYQKVFAQSGHCSCGDGDCRATIWRPTQLGSSTTYDVMVDRNWYPLPKDVYMPPGREVPEPLWNEHAHVCAYPGPENNRGITISCAIINDTKA